MIGAATARLLLQCSLAMGSCILLLAAVCAVFPGEWYMFIHRLLGLGEFPDQPVVWYLARSASALKLSDSSWPGKVTPLRSEGNSAAGSSLAAPSTQTVRSLLLGAS